MPKNSSNSDRQNCLANIPATAKSAEAFFLELANLHSDVASCGRFANRFANYLTGFADPSARAQYANSSIRLFAFELWRDTLRKVWAKPTGREREYQVMKFRDFFIEDIRRSELARRVGSQEKAGENLVLSAFDDGFVLPEHAFDKAVHHLFRLAARARFCGNPNCPSPYFFGSRRTQKYCSEDCALPSQRASKAEWWAKHGNVWRKARLTKGPKKSGKKGRDKHG